MSTVRTNNILDASGGNTATINSMTPTADSLQGFRNRIINGDMRIDQRNAGASVTFTSAYLVDRWKGEEQTDGAMTCQQVTDAPAGFVKSIGMTTTTADSSLSATQYAILYQPIEGLNVADLGWGTANAKTVTLSFWVKSSLTGTFGGALSNSAQNRSYPFTYTISSANTWEYKTVTVAGDTSGTWLTTNGIGILVLFGLGVGSTYSGTAGSWAGSIYLSSTGATSVIGTLNATWYITGVQLEVGSVATPFERRPYGTELALCQRYAWSTFPSGTAWGQNKGNTNALEFAGLVSNSLHSIPLKMPVTMRTTPATVTTYSTNAASANWGTNGNTPTASLGTTGQELIAVRAGTAVSVGAAYQIHVSAEAEL